MEIVTIAFDKLRLAKTNVRKSNGHLGIEELAANMLSMGQIYPLLATPETKNGFYEVYAGGRRFRAFALLIAQGKLPKDHPVNVELKERSEEEQRNISLSENAMRVAMTAADECLAFKQIIGKNGNIEGIAAQYAVTVKYVEGRLRLANLAKPIFEALGKGELTLDAAKQYAMTPDKKRQMATFERLKQSNQEDNAYNIRKHLYENAIEASDALAMFVGETAYGAAKGKIATDLFSTADKAVWEDGHIATDLATAKIEQMAEEACAANNLGWVEPVLSTHVPWEIRGQVFHYYPPRAPLTDQESERLAELEVEIDTINEALDDLEEDDPNGEKLSEQLSSAEDAYRAIEDKEGTIPDEMREHVGRFMVLTKEGEAVLDQQLYSRKETRYENDNNDTKNDGPAPEHSRPLIEELAITRRDVLAIHVANDPGLALNMAIYRLAIGLLGASSRSGMTVMIGNTDEPSQSRTMQKTDAAIALAEFREGLDVSWFDAMNLQESFNRFQAIDEIAKAQWLSFAVARSLKASTATNGTYSEPFHTMIGSLIEIDTAEHWRPTRDNYFGKLRKGTILERIGELGDPSLVSRYSSAKKGEIADAAEKIFSGTAMIDPEIKAKALAWVPAELSFSVEEGGAAAETDANEPELIDGQEPDTAGDAENAEAADEELVEA